MDQYTILGAGAIGSLLAVHLAARGHDPMIVDTDREHVDAIRAHGLTVVQPDGGVTTTSLTASLPEAVDRPLHVVLMAMKSHALGPALSWVAPRLAPDGYVVVCQNGDGYVRAADALGPPRVVPALINFAADRIGPGTIRFGGPGELAFGEIDGSLSARVARLRADFDGFGDVRATGNVVGLLWSKRILAVLLTATALTDDAVTALIDRHRAVMIALAQEAVAIARSQGARIEVFDGIDWERLDAEPDRVVDAVLAFLRGVPGKTRSGVFRDLESGRVPTEASHELARLLATARHAGLDAPLLRALHRAIVELEAGRIRFDEAHLDELSPAVAGTFSRPSH